MAKKQGVQTHTGWVAGGLFSPTLWRMAQRLPPTERAPKRVPKPNGNSVRAQAVQTDECIAAWRYEYETTCITIRAMAEKYGVDYQRMHQILTYRARANVDAAPAQPVQSCIETADPSHPITPLCASSGTDSPFFASR